jgi:heme A synthase
VAVAILTFGSGLLGLFLQKRLPQTHLSGGSKDMIIAVIGLLTLLLALVLGTLVGNTYAFFAMQKSELETMASRALLVDQALVQAGPEAKPVRDLMKQALTQSYDLFWRGADADPTNLKVDAALNRWRPVAYALNALRWRLARFRWRNVPDPRSDLALFRPVSGSAIGDPTDARGDRQIAPRAALRRGSSRTVIR